MANAALRAGAAQSGLRGHLARRFAQTRARTEVLAGPLSPEDQTVQSMPDASPVKWHRAHTSWFFETFCLAPHVPDYRPFDPHFAVLFNSYYETVGPQHARAARGVLSRPGADEITAYRAHVDAAMTRAVETLSDNAVDVLAPVIELGCQHEGQHQELIVSDLLHALAQNPRGDGPWGAPHWTGERAHRAPPPLGFLAFDEGMAEIGHDGHGFAFDNEGPRHRVWLQPFAIADRLITNGEYRAFIEDGGYDSVQLWHADGFARVRAEGWRAPLHWRERDGAWQELTPGGWTVLDPHRPLAHVSWFEASAYAAWTGGRLPTEFEWEHAAASPEGAHVRDWLTERWQWTASAYAPYPGFRAAPGALGEYNGKFMASQMVLRGGSIATPPGHTRVTYRNFFYPHQRWQFAGIRLAAGL